ncbi:MAG: hypothetical protein GY830_06920 [Bacteroidetes bacterium]|nr:hypothetical protein [Bacteroidota bacterium]
MLIKYFNLKYKYLFLFLLLNINLECRQTKKDDENDGKIKYKRNNFNKNLDKKTNNQLQLINHLTDNNQNKELKQSLDVRNPHNQNKKKSKIKLNLNKGLNFSQHSNQFRRRDDYMLNNINQDMANNYMMGLKNRNILNNDFVGNQNTFQKRNINNIDNNNLRYNKADYTQFQNSYNYQKRQSRIPNYNKYKRNVIQSNITNSGNKIRLNPTKGQIHNNNNIIDPDIKFRQRVSLGNHIRLKQIPENIKETTKIDLNEDLENINNKKFVDNEEHENEKDKEEDIHNKIMEEKNDLENNNEKSDEDNLDSDNDINNNEQKEEKKKEEKKNEEKKNEQNRQNLKPKIRRKVIPLSKAHYEIMGFMMKYKKKCKLGFVQDGFFKLLNYLIKPEQIKGLRKDITKKVLKNIKTILKIDKNTDIDDFAPGALSNLIILMYEEIRKDEYKKIFGKELHINEQLNLDIDRLSESFKIENNKHHRKLYKEINDVLRYKEEFLEVEKDLINNPFKEKHPFIMLLNSISRFYFTFCLAKHHDHNKNFPDQIENKNYDIKENMFLMSKTIQALNKMLTDRIKYFEKRGANIENFPDISLAIELNNFLRSNKVFKISIKNKLSGLLKPIKNIKLRQNNNIAQENLIDLEAEKEIANEDIPQNRANEMNEGDLLPIQNDNEGKMNSKERIFAFIYKKRKKKIINDIEGIANRE